MSIRKTSAAPLDIVLPVYNEAEAIIGFHQTLAQVCRPLDYQVTYLYVDDGSSDRTPELLLGLAGTDPRVRVIELSRNFGHQAAITAGLDFSTAPTVIMMDADGQHPAELIPEMVRLMESGYEVVLTQRVGPSGTSWLSRLGSDIFYRLINLLSDTRILPGGADFRLLSRPVVDALREMREYHRFLRGMTAWLGFRTVILPYSPPPRLAGKSKYSARKRVRLAMDAAFSFSLKPLYLAIVLAAMFLLLAVVEVIYVGQFWIANNVEHLAPGWSSLMFMVLIVGGTLSAILGILGIYIGYIFQEVKRRPPYVVRGQWGSQEGDRE